jgi:16S rRNA (cytosine1402-N4)-methyltransferase
MTAMSVPTASSDLSPGKAAAAGGSSYHLPVLPTEVLAALAPAPGKLLLDGTLGGGGHSSLLLEAGARVIGLDQDPEALAFAGARLESFSTEGRFQLHQGNFRDFPTVLAGLGVTGVDGILVDLGVSSHQLDQAARGFSFMHDGPLDMRMNTLAGRTAAEVVNEDAPEELERILWEYGEERQSRRIVRALVQRRQEKPFATTGELAAAVESVVPRRGKTHPATLTFQGLRIAVNDELAALEEFLRAAPALLNPGGRLAVISFHSLEDRLVKRALLRLSTQWLDRPEWPEPRPNPDWCLRLVHRKSQEASEEEKKRNPRSRSARLRVAEKRPSP